MTQTITATTPPTSGRRRILMVPYLEPSTIMSTLKLAKALRGRGHEISYLVTNNRLATFVQMHGFNPLILDASHIENKGEYLVPGLLPSSDNPSWPGTSPAAKGSLSTSGCKMAETRHPSRTQFANISAQRTMENVRKMMDQNGIDLVLLDPLAWTYAIPALLSGIKVLHLSSSLVQRANSRTPPSFFPRIPTASWCSRAQIVGDWLRLKFFRFRRDCRSRWTKGITSPKRLLRKQIRETRVRLVHGDYGYMFDLPQIMMMPQEFDFPGRQKQDDYHYMSATVDLDRAESVPFNFGWLDPKRKLLICSLGTYAFSWAEGFFRQFIDAMRRLPNWQAVLNLGPTISPNSLPTAENVLAVQGIPQLALLKRATLMVTHAGLNTVKECVSSGVPMLCVPCLNDEFGNAARVVYHALGVRADVKHVSSAELVALIELVDGDGYRLNLERFRTFFMSEESFHFGIRYIEQY